MKTKEKTKVKPNEKTQRILNYIVQYKLANDGLSPTLQEIMDGCKISSKSVVHYNLEKLIEAGYIERALNDYRGIKVVGSEWTPPLWYDLRSTNQ